MKRHDVIKLIGKWLVLGKQGFSKEKQDEYKDKNLADCILSDLEEAGMLPESYEGLMRDGTKFVRGENEGDVFLVRNQWEPEL